MINGKNLFDQPINSMTKKHTKILEKLLQVRGMTLQLVVY